MTPLPLPLPLPSAHPPLPSAHPPRLGAIGGARGPYRALRATDCAGEPE